MSVDQGQILLPLARAAITRELGIAAATPAAAAAWLQQPGSAFVTLTRDGRLRGRNGSLIPVRPLREDVAANAVAAAFRDPRFPPLTAAELETTLIEVSVLSALESLAAGSEAAVLRQLRPGVDGLVFRYGHHRSTFLPDTWSQYADPGEFLAQLKYKAGLPPDFWDTGVELRRYTVDCWREPGI
ncbi:MAG: AmmeMemoRadiSam system protein A [Burkholderiales bacterium]|nr:AmmeMemoRadiSam system protein A [Burkholderiales bacterium]